MLRVATLAHRCPHNHAFAQQQPATYRTNTVPPTERDACKQHKRERSTGLQGSGNEEGEQNGRGIKSSGGGAEQNYSGREEAIACGCAAASIPAGGAHRQLCAPLIARAPRNLCSSSLSRAFWVRSAGLRAARESPMAWAMKARVQSRSKGKGSETQRCRRAVTKRSSRRVGIHDGSVEPRAWVVFCTYKSILRLRGSCPGPTFRWAEQLQGLPQQAAAHCCTCQHAHSSFKDGSQALAALTYINHSS